MSELDRQLRKWADEAKPVSAEEARGRAAGAPDAARRVHRRQWVVAAALVLVVGAVAGAVAIGQRDGDRDTKVRTGSQPGQQTTTTVDITTTTPSTTTDGAAQATVDVPRTFLAHDDRNRLVVIDSMTGATIRTLASFDDPDAVAAAGEPVASGRFLGPFVQSPDGKSAYYVTCCEPAVGEVFRVPITGGEPVRVSFGDMPAISPDGTKLALVELQGLKVIDLGSGGETHYDVASNVSITALRNPSWSPDGTMLAIERYDDAIDRGRIDIVTFDGAEDVLNAAQTIATADDDGTPMFPIFDEAGRVHVVRQQADPDQQRTGKARLEVYDPFGQGEISRRGLDQPVLGQHYNADGTTLMQLFADGKVTIIAAGKTTTFAGTGFLDVNW